MDITSRARRVTVQAREILERTRILENPYLDSLATDRCRWNAFGELRSNSSSR